MVAHEPEVSVILPTYNRSGKLRESIKSVLGQTYEDFELIVVDDGSTDDTADVVDNFDDDRVEYIRHSQNKGAAAARNTGARNSSGSILAFQDSDDVWLEDKLSKQVDCFNDPSADPSIVYTGFWRISGDSKEYLPSPERCNKEGDIRSSLAGGNFIATQVAAVSKTAFEAVGGFDESLPRLQDWDLWIRMSENYEFKLVDEPLVRTYMDVDELSISSNDLAYAEAGAKIIEKYPAFWDENPSQASSLLVSVGHKYILNGKVSQGRRHLLKANRYNPSAKSIAAYTGSLLGTSIYEKLTAYK